MGKALTPQRIDALTLPADKAQQVIYDDGCPGLGVRLTRKRKAFVVKYRMGGKQRVDPIGDVQDVPLVGARRIAVQMVEDAKRGRDPRSQETAKPVHSMMTFQDAFEFYMTHVTMKHPQNCRWEFEKHILPRFGTLPVAKVSSRDVQAMVDDMLRHSGNTATRTAFARVRAMLNFCKRRGLVETVATDNVDRSGIVESSRDRVLAPWEMALVIDAARRDASSDKRFSQIVMVCAYTLCRRGEAAGMDWAQIDLANGLWTLPKEATKNGRQHTIPLVRELREMLQSIGLKSYGLVFANDRGTSYSGFTNGKISLDSRIREIEDLEQWTIHDVRRSGASILAEQDICPPHVADAILNHISGTSRAGVSGVYQKATYIQQSGAALRGLADFYEQQLDRFGIGEITLPAPFPIGPGDGPGPVMPDLEEMRELRIEVIQDRIRKAKGFAPHSKWDHTRHEDDSAIKVTW